MTPRKELRQKLERALDCIDRDQQVIDRMKRVPWRDYLTATNRVDAAIETCLTAERVGERSVLQSSFEKFAATVPNTPAELLAQIAFADEMRKRHSEFEEVDIFPTLVIAAKRLLQA